MNINPHTHVEFYGRADIADILGAVLAAYDMIDASHPFVAGVHKAIELVATMTGVTTALPIPNQRAQHWTPGPAFPRPWAD